MTAKKKKPAPPPPRPKFTTPTELPGGVDRIIEICEELRTRNTDGYLSGMGTLLANIKGGGHTGKAVTCSPLTGNVIGMAFDPKYPRDDLHGDPYEPRFNGGKDPLPFAEFYKQHNDDNDPVGSVIDYGLGTWVEFEDMRRGDQLAIDWWKGAGHSVFCWDVHLNAKQKVDCFQILGSHGPSPGYGLHVYWAHGKPWLTGSIPSGGKGTGTLAKVAPGGKIFVLDDKLVQESVWFGVPGVLPGSIDTGTFRVKPKYIVYAETQNPFGISVSELKVARFHYPGPPPPPYCMKDGTGSAPAQTSVEPPGHLDVKSTVVKDKEIAADPDAPPKVPPQPAAQEKAKPLGWQHEVETALQTFHRALWIEADPGDSEDINDARSQAAIKELQGKLKLDADGIVGPKTRAAIQKQLPACLQQQFAQLFLGQLFKAGRIRCDPGLPDGINNAATAAAVKDFQSQSGLDPSGLPDDATLEKLIAASSALAPTEEQHGASPALLALYWMGNTVAPGGTARLRLVSNDVMKGYELKLFLKDAAAKGAAELDTGRSVTVSGAQSELSVPVPAQFGAGCVLVARVQGDASAGKALELTAQAPLYVRAAQAGALEPFFKFRGRVGEGSRERDYTYVAYKVPGKSSAWFIKGRLMIDCDGAPNCYDPRDANVNTNYLAVDLENWKGSLDWSKNGGKSGNWFGVLTDTLESSGKPIIQGPDDPFPGFYVAITSLVDKTKPVRSPLRYVDARKIPYLAFPYQVWTEGKGGDRFTRVSAGHTGSVGDLLTVVNPKADAAHRYAHAIFADMGGSDDAHFGECSPALGQKIHAQGLAEPDLLYVLYPGSGAGQGIIPSAGQIHDKGEQLFSAWGGLDEAMRVLPLMK